MAMPDNRSSRTLTVETAAADGIAKRAARVDPKTFRSLQFQVDAPVARLTLNRPEHNLLNEHLLRELVAALESLTTCSEVKVVVLNATGKVFSGGMDIGEYTAERAFQVIDAFHATCTALLGATQPIVAVVEGPAIGGGAELAAFCDMVVVTPKARFALPEITIGMFPPLACTMFPHLVGPKLAMELILTGGAIGAERAHALGLANLLVPEAQLEKSVSELLARLTSQSGAVLAMAKRAVLGGMGLPLREALRLSMDIFLNELYRLEDSREGLRALVEKRKPEWKNR